MDKKKYILSMQVQNVEIHYKGDVLEMSYQYQVCTLYAVCEIRG